MAIMVATSTTYSHPLFLAAVAHLEAGLPMIQVMKKDSN